MKEFTVIFLRGVVKLPLILDGEVRRDERELNILLKVDLKTAI